MTVLGDHALKRVKNASRGHSKKSTRSQVWGYQYMKKCKILLYKSYEKLCLYCSVKIDNLKYQTHKCKGVSIICGGGGGGLDDLFGASTFCKRNREP